MGFLARFHGVYDDRLVASLRERERKAERIINAFRLAIIVFVAVIDGSAALVKDDMELVMRLGGTSTFGVIYIGLVHLFTRPTKHPSWLKFVTTAMDFVFLETLYLLYRGAAFLQSFSDRELANHFIAYIAVLLVLSVFRVGVPITIFASGCALVSTSFLLLLSGAWGLHFVYSMTPVLTAGAAVIALAASSRTMFVTLRQRDRLTRFLSPDMVESVARGEISLELGGEKRPVTILMCDIRGFTTLSEGLDPSALVDKLNRYFSRMTDVIFDSHGTVDKYIGDAILAVFGAPQSAGNDAACALRAALGMQSALAELNAEWEAEGEPPLNIGIGLHAGEALCGNIGSPTRMEYTVIGDAVNVASRVEGLTKEYGECIVVTEQVKDAVAGDAVCAGLRFDELGCVQVKGRQEAVCLYAPRSPPGAD